MKGSQDGAGRRVAGEGIGLGRGEGGVAEGRVMAAPPNGRVGGGVGAPARTGGWVSSPGPSVPPRCCVPSLPARTLLQPSSVLSIVWPPVFGKEKVLNRG